MKRIIKTLEGNWGKFEHHEHYIRQCDVSGGHKKIYLNVVYDPLTDMHYKFIEEMLDCKVLPELKSLYKVCNGMMLFDSSLQIYGTLEDYDDYYVPVDFVQGNVEVGLSKIFPEYKNMIIFGDYSSWLFCYDKNEKKSIYVIGIDDGKIVHEFDSIRMLLNYYISYFINEYDKLGKKIHYEKKYEGLPMANISTEFI